VGGGGVRAPRSEKQAWCHEERGAPRARTVAPAIAAGGANLAPRLGNPVWTDLSGRWRPHSVVLSGCEGGVMPQNGNPGSEQCAAARSAEEEG
jgi:hypothetical protein